VHMTNPNNEVCPGGGVAFIASITNGGSSPIIEWKINGSPAPASDVPEMGPSYLIYNSWNYPDSTPVQCFVKSSLACASTQSVGSEVINVGLTGTQAFWVGIEV